MALLDFLGLNDLFKFQPQNAPMGQGALPWQNPDQQLPASNPMPNMQPGQAVPWQNPDSPMAPNQLNPGYGKPTPWQNPDQQTAGMNQENLRRMIYMKQLMGNMGQQPQKQQEQPMPQAMSMPMGGGMPPMPMAGRMNMQAMSPQMQQRPMFMQPRAGRYLGLRSLGQ